MTTTTIKKKDGTTISHIGSSGATLTAIREGDHIETLMEFDQMSRQESIAMFATLLVQLEEIFGEAYIAQIFAHYAEDTGKEFYETGDHKIGVVRGGNRGKPPKRP